MAFRETLGNSNSGSGAVNKYSSNNKYGSATPGSQGTDINSLLAVARSQGGAIGEVAEELVNPKTSILTSMGNGFKKVFVGFGDVISAGSNIVAGAIDPNKSIAQALKEDLEVSDAIFGKKKKKESIFQTGARVAVDILGDPTTYLGFGAVRGIFGASALRTLKVTDKMADSVKKLVSASDAELGEVISKSLTKSGKSVTKESIDEGVTSLRKSLDPISKKRVGDNINLSVKAEKMIDTYIDNKRKGLGRSLTARELKETIIKKAADVGKKLKPGELEKRTKMALDNIDDAITQSTINARLSKDYASQVMSDLLVHNPGFYETLIDKGGIKFFGKSILSSQRISSVSKLIPGFNLIDNLTQPFRNKFKTVFSTNYTPDGRRIDSIISIKQRAQDLAESTQNAAINDLLKVGRRLRLDDNEMDLALSAMEHAQIPSDKKLGELYKALNGLTYDKNVIRPEVFEFTRFAQKLDKKDLNAYRAAGIPISNLAGHVRHFVKDRIGKATFKKGITSEPGAAKLRSVVAFVDESTEDRTRMIGSAKFVKEGEDDFVELTTRKSDGTTEMIKLKKNNISKMKDEIQTRVDDNIFKGYSKVDELQSEIQDTLKEIQSTFDDKTLEEFGKKLMGIVDMNPKTKMAILGAITKQIPKIDISHMVNLRLSESFENGIKVKKALTGLTPEDLEKVAKSINDNEMIDPRVIAEFNKVVKDIKPTKVETAAKNAKGVVEGAEDSKTIQEAISELKKGHKENMISLAETGLDSREISNVLSALKTSFQSTTKGVAQALDKIISRKQNISSIISDIDLERVAGKQELKDLASIQDGTYWDSFNNKQLSLATATVKEAKEFGVDMEENLFKVMALSSKEVTKTVYSKWAAKEIAENFGRLASEAPTHYVSVKEIKGLEDTMVDIGSWFKGKNGEEILFDPEVAKEIENMAEGILTDDSTGIAMKAINKLNGVFKASVTSIFPSFHGRNAISNVFLHFLDLGVHSLNPANHIRSIDMIVKNHKSAKLRELVSIGGEEGIKAADELFELSNKIMMTDGTGAKWTFGEMQSLIRDNAVGFSPNIVGQLDVTHTPREMVDSLADEVFPTPVMSKKGLTDVFQKTANPFSNKFVPFKWGRKVGSTIEDQARILSFMVNMTKSGNPIEAAARTKMFLFDYQNLTKFEKNVMTKMIPFYTFTRKNLELQAKTLLSNPGRINAELQFATSLGDVFSNGERLTQEELDALPEWMRNGLVTLYDRNGKDIKIMEGFETPTETAFGALSPSNLVASANPYPKLTAELVTGTSFFTGKPLSETTDATAFRHAPEILKDFIGYDEVEATSKDGKKYTSYVAYRPSRMHLVMGLPPTGGVLNKLKQLEKADIFEGGEVDKEFIMTQLFGIRIKSYDMEILEAQKEKELRVQIEKLLEDAKLGYRYTRYAPNK